MNVVELTIADVGKLRKTNDTPPRVSVYDVISTISSNPNARETWAELKRKYPEVVGNPDNFKFPGQGQRETPVTDARGIIEIIMLLPGRKAAQVRQKSADVIVRYLGGDPSLVPEIMRNRGMQEELAENDPSHPMRIFGETVESDAVKRIRREIEEFREEEVLDEMRRMKRIRTAEHELQVQTLEHDTKKLDMDTKTMHIAAAHHTYTKYDIKIDDRVRGVISDYIFNTFLNPHSAIENISGKKETCITDVILGMKLVGLKIDNTLLCKVGKKAKELKLRDDPAYEFPKKSIIANGQQVMANIWYTDDAHYIQKATRNVVSLRNPTNILSN